MAALHSSSYIITILSCFWQESSFQNKISQYQIKSPCWVFTWIKKATKSSQRRCFFYHYDFCYRVAARNCFASKDQNNKPHWQYEQEVANCVQLGLRLGLGLKYMRTRQPCAFWPHALRVANVNIFLCLVARKCVQITLAIK